MSTAIQPWTLLVVTVAGWIQREQQLAIEYLLEEFRELLKGVGTQIVRLPARSPNLNAYIGRFVLPIQSECLERIVFFGERSLRRAVAEFVRHYHGERNHQGLDNRLIAPDEAVGSRQAAVRCRQRWGGMLNYYYSEAA